MAIDLFKIGSITVHGYGLMIALGFLAAILYGMWQAKKNGLDDDKLYNLAICVLIFGWLGGKILFCIVDFKNFIQNPLSTLGSEGFVVYGGIISGIITIVLFCKLNKIDTLKYFDVICAAVPINQGFGRIGCFLAGCCYGRETDSAIGVIFPAGSMAPAGVKVLPTQIFSAIGNLLLFCVLFLAINNMGPFVKKLKKGMCVFIYLAGYSVGRFIIECFRNDVRGNVGALSTSQFISLIMLPLAIVYFIYIKKKVKDEETAS